MQDALPVTFLTLADAPVPELVARWRALDELGIGIWLPDHLAHPRTAGGDWFECWTLLGALARETRRVPVGTLVSPLLLRDPVVLARQALTADHLSGGRLRLGVGIGGSAWDHDALGVARPPPRQRAAVAAARLQRLDRLLRGVEGVPDGRAGRAGACRLAPRPQQQPRPPLVLGGNSATALGIAAAHADGWNCYVPSGTPLADVPRVVGEAGRALDAACAAAGREPASMHRSAFVFSGAVEGDLWASAGAAAELVEALGAAGMQEVVLDLPGAHCWSIVESLAGG